jgi:hypothetical protein
MDFEHQSHVWIDFHILSTMRYQPELGSFNPGGPVGCVWLHTEGINQSEWPHREKAEHMIHMILWPLSDATDVKQSLQAELTKGRCRW